MEYLIAFAIGIYILYAIIKYISSYPERKRLQEQAEARKNLDEMAHDVLAEFDFEKEREELELIKRKYSSPKYMCCPRCDGILVKRKGIYGDFWGCTRYPACKYTRGIS